MEKVIALLGWIAHKWNSIKWYTPNSMGRYGQLGIHCDKMCETDKRATFYSYNDGTDTKNSLGEKLFEAVCSPTDKRLHTS